jgi:lipopolysaccharide biosynthesis glycosyltransferase
MAIETSSDGSLKHFDRDRFYNKCQVLKMNRKRAIYAICLIVVILTLFGLMLYVESSDDLIDQTVPETRESLTKYGLNSCERLEAKNEIAVWTFLTDDDNYAMSAVKLLKSIRSNTDSISYDTNVMELKEKPLKKKIRKLLIEAGWTICQVRRIAPRDEEGTFPRFRDQFTKLAFWKLIQYKAHVYFDSDTFIVGNINELLDSYQKLDDEKYRLGVTRDIRASVWQETFNMGVFVVKPSLDEFNRLMALKANRNFKFETTMSEQGFLNVVYKDKWYEIGFEYNANLAAYTQQPEYWKKMEPNIRVIHYTMNKPWACDSSYQPVCDKWRET